MSASSSPTPGLATVLRRVIRGTGVLLMVVSGVVAVWWMGTCALSIVMGMGTGRTVGKFLFALVILFPSGLLAKIGWDMYRKINEAAAANLSFLVALFLCQLWYHFLPAACSAPILHFCRDNIFLSGFVSETSHGFSFRGMLAFLAFSVFYKLITAWLLQKLSLIRPDPKRPAPPEEGEAAEPFVPFDPYQPSPQSGYRPPL